MEVIFDKINNIIDTKQSYIYINGKIILSAKSYKSLKTKVKEEIENPSKDVKCFIISIRLDAKYKYPLIINCSQFTITPKLTLVSKDDDISQTFTYTEKELDNISFKLSHIKKIIKVLQKQLVSIEKSSVSITNVLNALEK